jgi:2'-5' RNA ligase
LIAPEPVRDRPRETALSLVVPEADALVDDFRRRFFTRTVARRIPPHVTLLYPFVDANAVDNALLVRLRELYAPVRPFEFELTRIERFPAHLWLAPEPRERLVELIRLTCAHFPECQPYGGSVPEGEPTPHLTIGEAGEDADVDGLATAAERDVGPGLPLSCAARTVSLLEERPDGMWDVRAELTLGGGA